MAQKSGLYEGYIKVAVDIEQEILVAGGVMHVDCEEILLEQENAQQQNIWGAGWYVLTQEVAYDSFINQRPPQTRSIYLQDQTVKTRVKAIVERFFAGVRP
jgi:hypothetical protein